MTNADIEAPGIVGSGLYDISIQCGSKDMSLEAYILILQKIYRQQELVGTKEMLKYSQFSLGLIWPESLSHLRVWSPKAVINFTLLYQ